MTHHAEPREVPAALAGTDRADLRTLAETRLERLALGNARALGGIDSALWFHTARHHRTHPANLEACDLCALLFELAVLLQTAGDVQ